MRRLAAGDEDIDIIGMYVIWTADFTDADWILWWGGEAVQEARAGDLGLTRRMNRTEANYL